MRIFHDIEYSATQRVDVYVPSTPPEGAILLFHGGGWVGGDKSSDVDLAKELCAGNFLVFAAEYGSTPGTPYLSAVKDALTAFKWLLSSPFIFDRNNVAAWGNFFGGSLATEIAASTGIPAVAWSPILDAKGFLEETAAIGDRDYDWNFNSITLSEMGECARNDQFLRWAILQSLVNNVSMLRDATVLNRVGSSCGPVMVVNSMDELVPPAGAFKFQQAMTAALVPTEVLMLPGQRHGYAMAGAAMGPSLAFVRRALRLGGDCVGSTDSRVSSPAISSFRRQPNKSAKRSKFGHRFT